MQAVCDIRALIFDMDGVIVHSNPVHREAWVAYNRSHGVETTEAMHSFMYGKRNDAIVRGFFGGHLTDAEAAAHGAAKEALYREMMRPVLRASLVPGVREFIERHRNLAIGLGTNAEPLNVRFVLEEADFGNVFGAIVDGHQVDRAKPAPDIYLKVADLLGVEPDRCVVFEDSFTGVEAALAAGMRAVAIRTTHPSFEGVSLAIDNFLDPQLEEWMATSVGPRYRSSMLKAVLLLLVQSYSGPSPSKADLPYLLHADSLIATEVTEAVETRGKDGSTFTVLGTNSNVKTPLASPIFIFKTGDLDPEKLQVLPLSSVAGHREIVFAKGNNPQAYTLTVKKLNGNVYRLEVNESLPNGEYAIAPNASHQAFCFAVY